MNRGDLRLSVRWDKSALLLLPVLFIGAGLRFYHIDHGLPSVVYVDAFKFVDAARQMVLTGDLEPRDLQYPGFYTYLLTGIYGLLGINSPYGLHLTARIVSACFGTGLICLTYLAGRRVCAHGGALLAAALTALSITCLTFSRIPATDCVLACFTTAGLWLLTGQEVRPRAFAAAGVCLGLAVGTKFTGLYFGLPLLVAVAVRLLRSGNEPRVLRGLACSLIAALLVFVLTTPWIIPKFSDYLSRFLLELRLQQYGQIGRVQHGYFDYLTSRTVTWEQPWLRTSLFGNAGPVVLATGLGACLLGLSYRFGFACFLHSLYVVVYLLLISRPGHLKAVRFLIPILPSLFIMSAWIVETSVALVAGRLKATAAVLAAVLVLGIPAYQSIGHLAMTRRTTTNEEALTWMKSNLPANASVLLSPFFVDNLQVETHRTVFVPEAGPRQYRVPGNPRANSELAPVYCAGLIDELRAGGIRYIVSNSYYDDAFSDIAENRRWFPRSAAAYAEWRVRLAREAELVYTVLGQDAGRLGPDIRIYRLQ